MEIHHTIIPSVKNWQCVDVSYTNVLCFTRILAYPTLLGMDASLIIEYLHLTPEVTNDNHEHIYGKCRNSWLVIINY